MCNCALHFGGKATCCSFLAQATPPLLLGHLFCTILSQAITTISKPHNSLLTQQGMNPVQNSGWSRPTNWMIHLWCATVCFVKEAKATCVALFLPWQFFHMGSFAKFLPWPWSIFKHGKGNNDHLTISCPHGQTLHKFIISTVQEWVLDKSGVNCPDSLV